MERVSSLRGLDRNVMARRTGGSTKIVEKPSESHESHKATDDESKYAENLVTSSSLRGIIIPFEKAIKNPGVTTTFPLKTYARRT